MVAHPQLQYTDPSLPPPSAVPIRPNLPRNNAYPQPTSRPAPSTKGDQPRPSIVTQLQKMHGLTRKRAATPRDPFIRDSDDSPVVFPALQTGQMPRAGGSSPPLPAMRSRRGTGPSTGGVTKKAPRRAGTGPYPVGIQPRIAAPASISAPSASSPSAAPVSPVHSVPMHGGYVGSPTSPTTYSSPGYVDAPETVYPSAPLSDTVSPPEWNAGGGPDTGLPQSHQMFVERR